jgi:S1-C subfamily serine protease
MRRWFQFGAVIYALCAARAAEQSSSPDNAALEKIVTAVGQVIATGGESADTKGSGVVVSRDGLVITCNHVLGNAGRSGRILFAPVDEDRLFRPQDPKTMLQLQLVRALPEYDLALLRIRGYADGRPLAKEQRFESLRIGRSDDLHLLESVYVIGFPRVGGQTVTVIEGHVAGKDLANQWLKLDAAISRGYSGGAVVNRRGELIGVPTEIRADIEDLRDDPAAGGEARVLYGLMSWVRPSEMVTRLLASPRTAELAPEPAAASGLIEGTVLSGEGKPLAGALVGLLKAGSELATPDNLVSYARTGADGAFTLRTIPGAYVLRTRCSGYRTNTREVNVSESVRIQISLQSQQEKR